MSEWHPIESAPKDGREILLHVGQCVCGRWESDQWWFDTDWPGMTKPTHWMPLPADPVTPANRVDP
jgi:hypothetical protein